MTGRPTFRLTRSRSNGKKGLRSKMHSVAAILFTVSAYKLWSSVSPYQSVDLLDYSSFPSERSEELQEPSFPRIHYFRESGDQENLSGYHGHSQGHRTVESLSIFPEEETDDSILPFERPFYEQCTPMAAWQTQFFPTCNIVHEAALCDMPTNNLTLVSMAGSWRSVWSLQEASEQYALKLLHLDRNFDSDSFSRHQLDAAVMERATASPHIIASFSFCGQSVLTEWAPETPRTLLHNSKLNTRERLKIGRDLARGFRDLHSLDAPNCTNPTFAHNDVNIANLAVVNGHLKLNDFNIGVALRWNGTKPCNSPVRFQASFWKSPEDIRNESYVDPVKSDIYSLGNILFQVMVGRQPWTHLEPVPLNISEVVERKLAGQLPHVPAFFVDSRKTTNRALYHAMLSCYRYQPHLRPTAHQLAEGLDVALNWARSEKNVSLHEIEHLFEVQP